MTRTPPLLLIVLGVVSAVVALLLQLTLGAFGLSKLVPQLTLSVTLLLIAVIVVVLAWPVRRATRSARTPDNGKRAPQKRRVDPFYATRVVLIAKASAVTGAILGGAGIGVLIELLSRPVSAASTVWGAVAMLVAAILVLVGGLIAESWCAVPPEDDEKPQGSAPA